MRSSPWEPQMGAPFRSPPCRSRAGWRGGNRPAQLPSVRTHCEHGIQNGKQQSAWVSFTAFGKHNVTVPRPPIFHRRVFLEDPFSFRLLFSVWGIRSLSTSDNIDRKLCRQGFAPCFLWKHTWQLPSKIFNSQLSGTHIIRSFKGKTGVSKLFCSGRDSKYFRLHGP